ncbi:MAG: type II secretion system protein GspJ [Deferrisomatales bacterium]|nr:type II secretion system protein GspJ [Deferrisomatales bacterium]
MRRGFTLLEVLLALALLALVLSLVQGAYSGAARSRNLSNAQTREVHAAAMVLDRLATELAAAFHTTTTPFRAQATGFHVDRGPDGLSTLSFVTRLSPLPGSLPGGEAEVGYLVERDREGQLRLRRRESRDLDGDPEEGGVSYEILPGVSRFEVLCYDGTDWVDGWDTGRRDAEPLLPLAVSVEIAWGEGEEERVLRTSTPVYRARRGPS